MTGIVNTAQAEAWNGYEGEHWATNYDRYDAVNGGFNGPLLDAAAIGGRDRVLDMGCGNGQVTRLAAGRARRGGATGVDLSGPMLATAQDRATADGIANVTFERGDIQVYPFSANAFDVAISRFGIMFFADPVVAFANVAHALRPGGRLAFLAMTSFAETELGAVFGSMAPYLPGFVAADGSGPVSFADPAHTRAVLSKAGFRDIECRHVEADGVWGRDVADAAEFISGWGPVRHHMQQVDEVARGKARAALVDALGPFAEPDAVRLLGTAWLVTAATPTS